jgi:hypothetical protein
MQRHRIHPRGRICGAALVITVSCPGCIVGIAPPPQQVSTNLVDREFIVPATRTSVEQVYEERAKCEAYLAAAEDGATRANGWRIGLAVVQGLLGASAAVTGSVSGLTASNASTSSGKAVTAASGSTPDTQAAAKSAADAQSSATKARVFGGIAAGSAGAAVLVLTFDNLFGPVKSREQYLAARKGIDDIRLQADQDLDAYAAEMRKSNHDIGVAISHMTAARNKLQGCRNAAGDLSWDLKSIRNYQAAALVVYDPFLKTVQYANLITAKILEAETLVADANKSLADSQKTVAENTKITQDPAAIAADKKVAQEKIDAAGRAITAMQGNITTGVDSINILKEIKRALDEGDNTKIAKLVHDHPELKLELPPSPTLAPPGKRDRKGS